MNRGLGAEVRAVLRQTAQVYRDSPATTALLGRHLERMDGPLRVAVAGKVKAGKSTLLNALVGEEIAPTDAGECTRVVTWYQHGSHPRITLYPKDSPPRPLTVNRQHGALEIDLCGVPPETVRRLSVEWPSAGLRETILIDTPGVGSVSTEISAQAAGFLVPEDQPSEADAVIYLMRHLHSTDLNLLESFHDRGIGRGNPVNTIAVLSRADELGVGRIDALLSAQRIARRYRGDERLRKLCHTVVPVAGLLAQSGRTLRHNEFVALAVLANAPRAEVEPALLSVDRFIRPDERWEWTKAVGAPERERLLARFGLFGIRLGLLLIRQGFGDPPRLAAELVRRSGLDELRAVLAVQFAERRDLLKARSALLVLSEVLHREPRPDAVGLRASVERLLAGAHEFTELRVLGALRADSVELPTEAREEAERLLGGMGGQVWARLGLPPDASREHQRSVAMTELRRWQTCAENPLSRRAFVDLARILVRTCEGMLLELTS